MLEQMLTGMSTDVRLVRPSEERIRSSLRYVPAHRRYGGNLSQIAKAAGKYWVTVRAALRAIGLFHRLRVLARINLLDV
jgi:hypothetical protein